MQYALDLATRFMAEDSKPTPTPAKIYLTVAADPALNIDEKKGQKEHIAMLLSFYDTHKDNGDRGCKGGRGDDGRGRGRGRGGGRGGNGGGDGAARTAGFPCASGILCFNLVHSKLRLLLKWGDTEIAERGRSVLVMRARYRSAGLTPHQRGWTDAG